MDAVKKVLLPFQPQQTTATHSQCGDICGRRNKNTVWQCARGGRGKQCIPDINKSMYEIPAASSQANPSPLPFPHPWHAATACGSLQATHLTKACHNTHTHAYTGDSTLPHTHTHAFLINFMQFVRAEVVQGQRKSAGRDGGMGNSRNALQFARVKPISAFLM